MIAGNSLIAEISQKSKDYSTRIRTEGNKYHCRSSVVLKTKAGCSQALQPRTSPREQDAEWIHADWEWHCWRGTVHWKFYSRTRSSRPRQDAELWAEEARRAVDAATDQTRRPRGQWRHATEAQGPGRAHSEGRGQIGGDEDVKQLTLTRVTFNTTCTAQ